MPENDKKLSRNITWYKLMKISFSDNFWQPESAGTHGVSELSREITLVFEDETILVVNKPAGLLSQPSEKLHESVLTWAAEHTFPLPVFLVHRLDRPVSGLLVIAKSAAVQTDLIRQMASGSFQKIYWAVVSPAPAKNSDQLTDFICKNSRERKSLVATKKTSQSLQAILTYEVVESKMIDNKSLALLKVSLQTGRFHQIRLQLSAAGFPIVGDHKYGDLQHWPFQTPKPYFPALQAMQIKFKHPFTKQIIKFTAPIPSSWPWNQFELFHRIHAVADGV